jgi:2-dehydropantoate 2-reductase
MKIAIAGAGAMGAMFGGYLAKAGHDVTLVDVDAEHVGAIRADGLRLRHHDGAVERIDVQATTDPASDLGPVDAVIVLCKGWANTDVARSIAHAVGRETWVATIQNGLGNDRALALVLPAERVLPGTTTAGAHRTQPGVVDVSPITSRGASITQLGPPRAGDGDVGGAQALIDALSGAGLPCELLPDADVVIWTKLAMAATAGPLTAAISGTVADMMSSEAARGLLADMFDEVLAVAAAEGVHLDRQAVWEHAVTTYEAVGPHTTSMADDFRVGRRSEIDTFCIEIARRGAAAGVPTPTHDVIGRLLVAREENRGLR